MESISNEILTIKADKHGAELCSVVRNKDGREFLWQADPAYWKRHSPVLFPIVGSLWNNEMRQDGVSYVMTQHGFARDMGFELIGKTEDELKYRLASNSDTKKRYPYDFELEIAYRLKGNEITVIWNVRNPSDKPMFFQIGAHPAFNYKDFDPTVDVMGYFRFDTANDKYDLSLIGEKGCLKSGMGTLEAPCGILPITRHTFDGDALVLEHGQVHQVALLDRRKEPYLRLSFDAPLVGLWSPRKGEYSPFVCIEPWYGRCDRERYDGSFAGKDWMQQLDAGSSFSVQYTIEIL